MSQVRDWLTIRPLESRRNPPPWDAICLLLAFFVFVGAVCLGMTWVGGQR